MPVTHNIKPESGDVLLLVGTMKGAFILRADEGRKKWEMGGPYFPGSAVYAMAYDGRFGRQRLWAGPASMHWGALLRSSDDFGKTWTDPEIANVRFPEGTDAALKNIWQIVPGRDSEATRSTAASSPRRCSSRPMRAIRGTWWKDSGIIRSVRNGSRAAADFVCTRSSSIPPMPRASVWRFRPPECT
jgi:hypothetical protein